MKNGDIANGDPVTREHKAERARLRAAWLYYVEGLTQNEVAERLAIGRVTVVRYINEAKQRREVKIRIEGKLADCVALEMEIAGKLGLDEAVVVPDSGREDNVDRLVGFAAGMYISDLIHDDMSIGVGWGNTLHHSLQTLSPRKVENVTVVSLLGGVHQARSDNPAEFAWQFASALGARCFMLTAPAVVDSRETKQALIERCGLGAILRRAERLDLAIVSVGSVMVHSTALRHGVEMYPGDLRTELIRAGAVGDMFYNFFDADGRLVDHPINERVICAPIDQLRRTTSKRLLISGGMHKAGAILGGIKLLGANTLITNETTARELLVHL